MTEHNHLTKNTSLTRYFIPIIILALILSACGLLPQQPTQPPATEPPQSTEKQIPDSPIPPVDTAPVDTAPPEQLPATPTPTFTLEPTAPPTFTPMPYVMISGNTNCRTGPGSVYDWLHTYLVGDEARVLGKSPDGFFWYTTGKNSPMPECWLWGQYATPVGDTTLIPVFTPPPTPTPNPDYEIELSHIDVAAGSWYLFFEIENTGSATWESALLYIYDPVSFEDSGRFSNTFQVNNNHPDPTQPNIPPGGTAYFHGARISNPMFEPGGGLLDIYFIACTQQYLGGYCKSTMYTIDVSE